MYLEAISHCVFSVWGGWSPLCLDAPVTGESCGSLHPTLFLFLKAFQKLRVMFQALCQNVSQALIWLTAPLTLPPHLLSFASLVVVKYELVLLCFYRLRLDTLELKACPKVPGRGGGRMLDRGSRWRPGGKAGGAGPGFPKAKRVFRAQKQSQAARPLPTHPALAVASLAAEYAHARARTQTHTHTARDKNSLLVTSSGLGKQKPLWVPAPPATGADALIAANCHCPLFIFSLLRLFLVHFKCLHTFP